ncbi:MAG: hypothetical protein ACTSSE_01170 [Candidatus Thorarchaeota archaeon]
MKQSGKCPKCESTNIWNNSHLGYSRNRSWREFITVSIGRWELRRKWVYKIEYTCLDCGYSESYIDDRGLKTIRDISERERPESISFDH